MQGRYKKRLLLALLFIGMVCMQLSEPLLQTGTDIYAADARTQSIADGVYTIEGRLRKADEDRASMGNPALTGSGTAEKATLKLRKSGESLYLQLEFHPLTAIGFTGYLYSMSYFPDAADTESIPKEQTGQPVIVTQYYTGIYDTYNDKTAAEDTNIQGRYYPHYAVMPVTWNQEQMWVQVYVPVMEALGKGQGTQYAKLLLDWSTVKKTKESVESISITASADTGEATGGNTEPKTEPADEPDDNKQDNNTKKKRKLDKLKDGVYTIQGSMLKTDKKTKSMSDNAINHNVLLTVRDGSLKLTLTFRGMTVGSSEGYLSRLKYYSSAKTDENGIPNGKTKAAKVDSYQEYTDGERVSDAYGSDYPAKVTFPLIASAKEKGYVPLQVYVPIMEAISAGSGTQAVYLKLDLSTVVSGEKGQTDEKIKKEEDTEKPADSNENPPDENNPAQQTQETTDQGTENTSAEASQSSGKVYSCKIVPGYKHPVDGTIEDSGGASSYATGQGMVESAVAAAGMLEETADGAYYLTLRMKLMDYTSDHTFKVQKRGESGWQSCSAEVTASGSDANGKTSDMCIPVPSQDCIVRVAMYVQPMGRNVIFYCYPTEITEGQPSDMKATKVNASSAGGQASGTQQIRLSGSAAQADTEAAQETKESETKEQTDTEEIISGEGLSGAQGLSLSVTGKVADTEKTAGEAAEIQERNPGGGSAAEQMTVGKWILVMIVSLTVSGLLLMGAGAGLVYYFRRNWNRWGEAFDDDKE